MLRPDLPRHFALLLSALLAVCGSFRIRSAPLPDAAAGRSPPATFAPVLASTPWKGDLDGMTERRLVRILVVYSKTFYFIDKAQQHGISYEAGRLLEKALNAGRTDRPRAIRVVFIPTPRDRLLPALLAGRGDIVAAALTVTPVRLRTVDFTVPIAEDVSEILVCSPGAAAPAAPEGLSGHTVFVRASSSYFTSLQGLNAQLKSAGKLPVRILLADENLEDEDILEMVNAGLVPATIVDEGIAEFWQRVFTGLELHPEVAVSRGGEIAWAIRKQSPLLKAALEPLITRNRLGTKNGNLIFERYLRDTHWARTATAQSDMERFGQFARYFQKYAGEYSFEWLLLVAQGYQESGLNQNARSPAGAIGVMQVLPSTAAEPSVNIPNIDQPEPNIHAGIKYLRFLVDEYFSDPAIDSTNRHLFAFAAYNAGATRIARMREEARAQGLDPNRWFNNVELLAAR
jgi:membrane-bound lytic murein transglycosylase MltF